MANRQEKFEKLIDQFERTEDPIRQHMATVMISFLAGLFVGAGKFEQITDNLELERWFRLPKSHERRIHGHRHAGIALFSRDLRWCMLWTHTSHITGYSPQKTCYRIGQHKNRSAKKTHSIAARL